MLRAKDINNFFSRLEVSAHEVGVVGRTFTLDIPAAALNDLLREKSNPEQSWSTNSINSLTCSIERESDTTFLVKLQGAFSLWIDCVRCLGPIEHRAEIISTIRMVKHEHAPDEEKEILFEGLLNESQDIIVGSFSGPTIDIGLMLREQLFLTLPDYPHCGGDLAVLKSSCERELPNEEKDLTGNEPAKPFLRLLSNFKF